MMSSATYPSWASVSRCFLLECTWCAPSTKLLHFGSSTLPLCVLPQLLGHFKGGSRIIAGQVCPADSDESGPPSSRTLALLPSCPSCPPTHLSSALLCSPLLSSALLSSPLLASPRLSSPLISSLRLSSPSLSYPILPSPLLSSPLVSSPHLCFPLVRRLHLRTQFSPSCRTFGALRRRASCPAPSKYPRVCPLGILLHSRF